MKNKKDNTVWVTFSCMKASEGGMTIADTIETLKSAGVKCKRGGYSPFVGHFAVLVAKEDEDKASDILWG